MSTSIALIPMPLKKLKMLKAIMLLLASSLVSEEILLMTDLIRARAIVLMPVTNRSAATTLLGY